MLARHLNHLVRYAGRRKATPALALAPGDGLPTTPLSAWLMSSLFGGPGGPLVPHHALEAADPHRQHFVDMVLRGTHDEHLPGMLQAVAARMPQGAGHPYTLLHQLQERMHPANAHLSQPFTPGDPLHAAGDEATKQFLGGRVRALADNMAIAGTPIDDDPVGGFWNDLIGRFHASAYMPLARHVHETGSLPHLLELYGRIMADHVHGGPAGRFANPAHFLGRAMRAGLTARQQLGQLVGHATAGTHERPDQMLPEDYYAL